MTKIEGICGQKYDDNSCGCGMTALTPAPPGPPARTYPAPHTVHPASRIRSGVLNEVEVPTSKTRALSRVRGAHTSAVFFKSVCNIILRSSDRKQTSRSRESSPESAGGACAAVHVRRRARRGAWRAVGVWLRQRVPEGLIARWRGAPGATLRVDISARWCRLSHRPRSSFHRHTQVIAIAPQGLSKSSL
jgi:hypothetical protein